VNPDSRSELIRDLIINANQATRLTELSKRQLLERSFDVAAAICEEASIETRHSVTIAVHALSEAAIELGMLKNTNEELVAKLLQAAAAAKGLRVALSEH
jgi:metal-responsive CopG/Arc/MetJ family transcriptional regulator